MGFDMLMSALGQVLSWPTAGFMLLGVMVGLLVGAIPGLAGVTGLVLILPFTFGMEPVAAMAMLLGAFAVTATGDTITAILLGVPGTAASQATVLDGYPLAKQGQAGRALGAAYSSSLIGGVLGGVFMFLTLPLIAPIILLFGMPEFFLLAVLGLTMVAALSGRSLLKGLGAGAIGLMLSMIGYAPVQAIPRYAFGIEYLYAGLPLLPFLLGIFGLPELVDLAANRKSISDVSASRSVGRGILEGVRDTFRQWWLVIRCSVVGIYVGLVPGIGGAVADWFAYSHAVQSSKDKSNFGKGDIRGVIAPEAATNSLRGGELIPTVAFGIPGSAGMAVLLSAMLIHGLRPGATMLTTQVDITFSLVWTLIFANIIAALVMMACSQQIAKVAFLPSNAIIPGIVVLLMMGAFMANFSIGDWVTLIAAGALGYWLKQAGWPRPPLVLAIVLGPIMEPALRISMLVHGPAFLIRPMSLIIIAIVVFVIARNALRYFKDRREMAENPVAGEGYELNPPLSIVLSAIGIPLFAGAALLSLQWPASAQQFPLVIAAASVVIFGLLVMVDTREMRAFVSAHGGIGGAIMASANQATLIAALPMYGWFLAILAGAILIGQEFTLILFVIAFLALRSRYSWKVWVPYAIAIAVLIFGLYDDVLNVFWHQPIIPLRAMIGL